MESFESGSLEASSKGSFKGFLTRVARGGPPQSCRFFWWFRMWGGGLNDWKRVHVKGALEGIYTSRALRVL